MKFDWRRGYEWELPNELDREFDRSFKGILKGSPVVVTCRSPWVRLDLDRMPGVFQQALVIGVNLSVLTIPANYCVSGGDPQFWRHVRPAEWPKVNFVLSGSQRNLEFYNANQWPNVRCYTAPPELPPGMQKNQRNLPRPFRCDNSGNVAVWLAWYMGASPVYIAGAQHKLCAETIHGDSPELDESDEALLRHYRNTLPLGRSELQELVLAMRQSGTLVHWPGEEAEA